LLSDAHHATNTTLVSGTATLRACLLLHKYSHVAAESRAAFDLMY